MGSSTRTDVADYTSNLSNLYQVWCKISKADFSCTGRFKLHFEFEIVTITEKRHTALANTIEPVGLDRTSPWTYTYTSCNTDLHMSCQRGVTVFTTKAQTRNGYSWIYFIGLILSSLVKYLFCCCPHVKNITEQLWHHIYRTANVKLVCDKLTTCAVCLATFILMTWTVNMVLPSGRI